MIVIDDLTRYGWVIGIHSKSDWVPTMIELVKKIQNETKQNVSYIRSDGGELHTTSEFKNFVKANGITMETSPSEDKEFNGMVERYIQYLRYTTITLMQQANFPKELTLEALKHACYLKNRVVHSATKKIPYVMYHDRNVKLDQIYPFGCQVTIYKHMRSGREKRKQAFVPRGDAGVLVGYDGNTIFRVYNHNTAEIERAYHVKIHPERFPGVRKEKHVLSRSDVTNNLIMI